MMYAVHVESYLLGSEMFGPFASYDEAQKWIDKQKPTGYVWFRIDELVSPEEVA